MPLNVSIFHQCAIMLVADHAGYLVQELIPTVKVKLSSLFFSCLFDCFIKYM